VLARQALYCLRHFLIQPFLLCFLPRVSLFAQAGLDYDLLILSFLARMMGAHHPSQLSFVEMVSLEL
jgi:hypothetical protein